MTRIIYEQDGVQTTNLDHLVDIVTKREITLHSGIEKTFSVRVPIGIALKIDAMARNAGVSRNSLCIDFLEFAMDEVWDELDLENKGVISAILEEISLDGSLEGA